MLRCLHCAIQHKSPVPLCSEYKAPFNGVTNRLTLGRNTDLLGLGYYTEQHRGLMAECGLIGSIDM